MLLLGTVIIMKCGVCQVVLMNELGLEWDGVGLCRC